MQVKFFKNIFLTFYNYLKLLKAFENFLFSGRFVLDPVSYVLLDDKKLAYAIISKAACTSIRAAMGKNRGLYPKTESGLDLHGWPGWHIEPTPLKSPFSSYYKFTFVRNPFERLVSCYNDRVVFLGPNEDFSRYYFETYPFSIPPNISFHEFVHRVVRIPDGLADRHFRKQSYSLFGRKKKCKIDFIGKVENLKEDWSGLADKKGLSPDIGHLNKGNRHNHVSSRDYRTCYTEELVDLVYRKFKDDVELFGYQEEYRDLRDFTAK